MTLRTSAAILALKSSYLGLEDPHMETFPDLGSLNDQELKDLIKQLTEEERDISYRRRILHGKIDIIGAELVRTRRRRDDGDRSVRPGGSEPRA